MALINCEECGHEISESAESCPQCGAVLGEFRSLFGVTHRDFFTPFFVAFLIILFLDWSLFFYETGYAIFGTIVLGLFIKILIYRLVNLVIWIMVHGFKNEGFKSEEYKGSTSQMIDCLFLWLISIVASIAGIYIVAIPTCILAVTLSLNYNKHSKD